MDGVSRRNFLQLMGASLALAGFGLAGCRRPEAYITPFSKTVEWMIPGKALFYASSMPTRKGSIPLVVTTYDGRPTKVEGNPLLPGSTGATNVFAQASVLSLYDPDRARRFRAPDGSTADFEKFQAYLATLPTESIAFVLEENNSPTRARLRKALAKRFPQAQFCVYEPCGNTAGMEAHQAAFGADSRARLRLENADVILSLGADFLGPEGTVEETRAFSSRRRVESPSDTMNRLYVVEHRYTITGGMADHRLRLRASEIANFASLLASKLGVGNAPESVDAELESWANEAARDLQKAGSRAVVVAGATQPAAVHLLAASINSALGSLGTTVTFQSAEAEQNISIAELAEDLKAGSTTVVVCGGNPSYNAPADLDFPKLLKSAPHSIRLGYYEDETSRDCKWHVPMAHYLESWSDGLTPEATYVPVQPMILPIFGGLTEHELFAMLAEEPTAEPVRPDGAELVRETFRSIAQASDFESAWTAFLRDGFLPESSAPDAARSINSGAALQLPPPASDGIELVLIADYKVDDGRYINNGWLQELPDPITKLTWDNAAWISPATALELGVRMHEMAADTITIEANGASVTVPIIVAPGHADRSITLPLGYGQALAGKVGAGTGVNAYPLRTSTAPYIISNVKVAATGEKVELAITHGHWTMEGRELFREGTLAEYQANPEFAKTMGMDSHIPPDISLYRPAALDAPEQWGMAVDLNTCTGCNACVIACQSENNIPIVGKEQVIKHREMHWMRIDRYFSSVTDEEPNPAVGMQPVACMHCEMAPCETVCPVNATVHSEDGLNVMAYNRCIGTRYCANNCPYKVRRFNFFDYNKRKVGTTKKGLFEADNLYFGPLGEKQETSLTAMQKNPNVSVRMRGVMEKCTFCIQRIEEARINTRVRAGASANLKIPTDSIKTACQQACPASAIVFGDISDPESTVSKLKARDRDYVMLKYLNTRPRLSYSARLRNPNRQMPGADKVGAMNHVYGHGDAEGDTHGPGVHEATQETHH